MSVVTERPGRSLPTALWPVADQERWLGISGPGGLSRKRRPQDHHRPETRRTLEKIYGQWLAWLADAGLLDPRSTPEERVTETNILAYLEGLRSRLLRAQSVLTTIESMDSMIAAISPRADRTLLKCVIGHLQYAADGEGPIERPLVPIIDLYNLGLSLMELAEGADTPSRKAAIIYRDGLLIALLAAVPIRRKNAVSLTVGSNLVWEGNEARILLSSSETKNSIPYEAACPPAVAVNIERYLETYRPILLGPPSLSEPDSETRLWINLNGEPLSYDGFYWVIRSRTRARFGFAICPHHFRRCAATSIAVEDPGHVGVSTTILGHGSPRTTKQYYNLARNLEASRRLNDVICEVRRKHRTRIKQTLAPSGD